MEDLVLYFFMAIWTLFMVACVLNLYRLDRFSKFMHSEVERVYLARMAGFRDIPYPNVNASYRNLKWYDVFNYKFDRVVVYDATSR